MLKLIDSESLSYSASMASKSSLTYPRIQVRHRRDADYKDGFFSLFRGVEDNPVCKEKERQRRPVSAYLRRIGDVCRSSIL